MKKRNLITTFAIAMALSGMAGHALAAGMDDPRRADYVKTFDGKTIAFVPSTMGIDLTEGGGGLEATGQSPRDETRDPRSASERRRRRASDHSPRVGKADVIIAHNLDVQSYAKLLKRAEDAGIHVIQVSMRSNYNSDAYVGADWIAVGEAETQAIVDRCGAGTSGKVAIFVGQPTAGSDSGMLKGAENVLAKHPEIKLVANQAADWDANKARNVIATVIRQNPDLCGVVGFWDVMDLGAAAAIKESGKPIALVTSGGGEQMACDNVEKGVFQEEIAYHVMDIGRDLTDVIQVILESGLPAGQEKIVIYSPTTKITKETLRPGLCWSVKNLEK